MAVENSKKKLYDNCKALGPNGQHMFYCSRSKANSYIKKELGRIISEDPYIFQLLFEPKGKGNPDYGPRENKCVRCNTEENLTRHHIVPYSFRREFLPEFKDHRSEEVVPMCRKCHDLYELESTILRKDLTSNNEQELSVIKIQNQAVKARRILEYGEDLTEEKILELKNTSEKYLENKAEKPEKILTRIMGAEILTKIWKEHFYKWLNSNLITA